MRGKLGGAIVAALLVVLTGCSTVSSGPGVVAPPVFAPGVVITPTPSATTPVIADPPPDEQSESAQPQDVAAATLVVPNYCVCEAPRNQAQVKLKVGVTNNSNEPLNIAADRFRLSVSHTFAADWTPKDPVGKLSTYGGTTLVPANADGSWESFNGAATFATHWSESSLQPGATYLDTGVKRGDLVFYIPVSADQTLSISGIVLLDDDDIPIGYTPFTSFGPSSDPNTF